MWVYIVFHARKFYQITNDSINSKECSQMKCTVQLRQNHKRPLNVWKWSVCKTSCIFSCSFKPILMNLFEVLSATSASWQSHKFKRLLLPIFGRGDDCGVLKAVSYRLYHFVQNEIVIFLISRFTTSYGQRSFSYWDVTVWNKLGTEIENAPSLAIFKHFLEQSLKSQGM